MVSPTCVHPIKGVGLIVLLGVPVGEMLGLAVGVAVGVHVGVNVDEAVDDPVLVVVGLGLQVFVMVGLLRPQGNASISTISDDIFAAELEV